jgi:hypothetical protein
VASSRGNGSVGDVATHETVHRGVRWRRDPAGRISWFNDGLGRWVTWSPGADAPPLPPGWGGSRDSRREGEAARAQRTAPPARVRTTPTDAMSRRPSMRSPYRLVPLFITAFIVAIAVWQATRPAAHASKADIAAAEALTGDCLARNGGTATSPVYSPVPVSCTAGDASVKVVAVLVPGPGRPAPCPPGSLVVQVLEPNVVGEPSECVLALHE